MEIIFFLLYILIGSLFVLVLFNVNDIPIKDTKNFSFYVVLVCLWPAVLVCGIILTIMDWFDNFTGGSGLFV